MPNLWRCATLHAPRRWAFGRRKSRSWLGGPQATLETLKVSQLSGAMTNLIYRCRYQRGDEVPSLRGRLSSETPPAPLAKSHQAATSRAGCEGLFRMEETAAHPHCLESTCTIMSHSRGVLPGGRVGLAVSA